MVMIAMYEIYREIKYVIRVAGEGGGFGWGGVGGMGRKCRQL